MRLRPRFAVLAVLLGSLFLPFLITPCLGQAFSLEQELEAIKKRLEIRDREFCLECIDNSTCLKCHEEIDEMKFVQSVHGANSCNSCHWDITDINEHTAGGARIQIEPVTCHRCHKVEGIEHYASVHFINDIRCQNCHIEIHQITPWRGNKVRVIQRCTICHEDDGYASSVHGLSVLAANSDAAVCSDCHELHKTPILSGEEPERVEFRRLFHTKTCQKCHADTERMRRNKVLLIASETYESSIHGKVEYLGGHTLVAGCADCHGFHSIRPRDWPRSTISKSRLEETCGKCHGNTNPNFIQWIAHADHYGKEHYPLLYWTFVFMTSLLIGIFCIFWLHSLLWWQRAYRETHRMWTVGAYTPAEMDRSGEIYERFTAFDITIHFIMMVSFLLLVLTGLPLKFSHADWARGLVKLFGGVSNAGLIHRICAVVTFGYFAAFVVKMVSFVFSGKDAKGGLLKRLFGPDSLAPRWQDVRDMAGMGKWFFGKGPKPRFDRWTYWEKLDFFAVFFGMSIIGLSGLMLWFPGFFSIFLPGWVFNVALIVHSDEALLASGFIFTVHFFNTHFRPEKFPMNVGIFTGRFRRAEFIADRPSYYDRLVAEKNLDAIRRKHPSLLTYLWGHLFGFAALVVGIISVLLVVWAFVG